MPKVCQGRTFYALLGGPEKLEILGTPVPKAISGAAASNTFLKERTLRE
jgi:hypothetical protein